MSKPQPLDDTTLRDLQEMVMKAHGILRVCVIANEATHNGEIELTYPMQAAADLLKAAGDLLRTIDKSAMGLVRHRLVQTLVAYSLTQKAADFGTAAGVTAK